MKRLYDLPAPAKLNLFLHITGRRPDGYHCIESVFVPIDWMDLMSFEMRHDGHISRTDQSELTTPLPTEDLSVRAARLLQTVSGTSQGVHIHLQKHIPTQAGLGGGSSNAATTLIALNRLWGLGLTRAELIRLGLQLGADVPFFLGDGPAWVQGIGEKLSPIQVAPRRLWVIHPGQGLSTAAIFGSQALKRDSIPATMRAFVDEPFGFGRNDLQPVAEALCPPVSQVCNWMSKQGLQPRMTGSGSAVFAVASGVKARPAWPQPWLFKDCYSLEAHPLSMWV